MANRKYIYSSTVYSVSNVRVNNNYVFVHQTQTESSSMSVNAMAGCTSKAATELTQLQSFNVTTDKTQLAAVLPPGGNASSTIHVEDERCKLLMKN